MDQTLTRNESKELMQLLELQMDAWGNMPLMKRQYLQKCKVFHPDKGGDENKMKRLTELWDKLCTTLQEVHTQNVEEDNVYNVSEVTKYCPCAQGIIWKDFNATTWQMLDPHFELKMCKNYETCSMANCYKCIYCILQAKHMYRVKLVRMNKPLVWIQCYCIKCFCDWFGLVQGQSTFAYYCFIIKNTPWCVLNIINV
ncbi:small T antigen [Rabbit polyomavirus]|nr:small T antigen [Rabbit polyomavirus]